jgi:hypothetical protein
MTKDRHKLSPILEGPFQVVEGTRPGLYRLQREDGSDVPNAWNIDQLRLFYMLVILCTFSFLLAALTYMINPSAMGL